MSGLLIGLRSRCCTALVGAGLRAPFGPWSAEVDHDRASLAQSGPLLVEFPSRLHAELSPHRGNFVRSRRKLVPAHPMRTDEVRANAGSHRMWSSFGRELASSGDACCLQTRTCRAPGFAEKSELMLALELDLDAGTVDRRPALPLCVLPPGVFVSRLWAETVSERDASMTSYCFLCTQVQGQKMGVCGERTGM